MIEEKLTSITREINVNYYFMPKNRDMHFLSGDQKLCIIVFILKNLSINRLDFQASLLV